VICGGPIVQPNLNLAGGKARPISGVNRDDIIGAGSRCNRQQRGGEQTTKTKPMQR